MESTSMQLALPTPTSFEASCADIVVASTFDPFGISGPLQLWLERLAGFRPRLRWVGYGLHSIVSALTSAQSEWNANSRGVNLLFARDCDLGRTSDDAVSAAQLAQALAESAGMRKGKACSCQGTTCGGS